MPRIGPFELRRVLAQGGMGVVWAGHHVESDTDVAIKLLTHKHATQPRFRRAFRNEVRAVAGLDHAHIAAIYDHGECSEADSADMDERIPPGAPWLAMEYVRGGTLHNLTGRLQWPAVERVARSLLDALAHAHARGVVHRDLKPANVLINWRNEMPFAKLTDFGLAHAAEDAGVSDDEHFFGGTPSFMAPEQFHGRWRDFGPWTDLYGFGCLMWALVAGRPPYGTKGTYEEKAWSHSCGVLPKLEPAMRVPRGFEGWLQRLLAKDASSRYRRAADALHGLSALGPIDEKQALHEAGPIGSVDTLLLSRPTPVRGSGDPTQQHEDLLSGVDGLPLGGDPGWVAPMPRDWKLGPGYLPGDRQIDAGLGLFGLRQVPMAGRDAERNHLWDNLVKVSEIGLPHLTVIRGKGGVGKSFLAKWFCERAHEVGAATALRAEHSPVPGAVTGLGPMVNRFLRCQGLTRHEVLGRVQSVLESSGVTHKDEAYALSEVIGNGRAPGRVSFRSSTERYVTVRRMLQVLVQHRPVVLLFEDVQWGLDALGFCQHLLGRSPRRSLPVYILLTSTDEALAQRRDEAKLLAELLEMPHTDACQLGPLQERHRAELISGLISLEAPLADRVQRQAAGQPRFALEMITDWVDRGMLESGPKGIRLVDKASDALPSTMREVWAGRVRRFLARRSTAEGRAIELAAVLGTDIDMWEWRDVATEAVASGGQADPSDELVDALLEQRLIHCSPEGPEAGWSFAHPMLRAAMVARARAEGRLAQHERMAASIIRRRYEQTGKGSWRLAERLGRHLAAAGDHLDALAPLLQAADARALCGDYALAAEVLDLREASLRQAGVPKEDERWGIGWLARHRVAQGRGDYSDATQWLEKLESETARHAWPIVEIRTMALRGEVERLSGNYALALEVLTTAERKAMALSVPRWLGDVRYLIATVLSEHGDLAAAERWVRRAMRDYELSSHEVGSARSWMNLGLITTETGRHSDAAQIFQEAERRFEALGDRWGMASSVNSQGDVARYQGRLGLALDHYRRARGLFRAIGSASWIFPHYNVALVHIARRQFSEAQVILEEALPRFLAQGHRRAQVDAMIGLATCAGAVGRWLHYDQQMEEVEASLRSMAAADEDTARALCAAGDIAVAKSEPARARQAYLLARVQWQTLGRTTEVQHLDAFLAQI